MPSGKIVETRALYYGITKSRPILKFVVGLRKDQIDYLDRWKNETHTDADTIRSSEHLGNAGYVSPKNIKSYECPECKTAYEDRPVLKVRISDMLGSNEAKADYFCQHCNAWLATIPMFDLKEQTIFIEKEFVSKDYTGKIIPFSKEIIDSFLEETVKQHDNPHFIFRLEGDLEKIKKWGKEIDYNEIDQKIDGILGKSYTTAFEAAVLEPSEDLGFEKATYLFKKLKKPPSKESAEAFYKKIQVKKEKEKQKAENHIKKTKSDIEELDRKNILASEELGNALNELNEMEEKCKRLL